MKCPHCKEDIGNSDEEHDEYDLMQKHLGWCESEVARRIREVRE